MTLCVASKQVERMIQQHHRGGIIAQHPDSLAAPRSAISGFRRRRPRHRSGPGRTWRLVHPSHIRAICARAGASRVPRRRRADGSDVRVEGARLRMSRARWFVVVCIALAVGGLILLGYGLAALVLLGAGGVVAIARRGERLRRVRVVGFEEVTEFARSCDVVWDLIKPAEHAPLTDPSIRRGYRIPGTVSVNSRLSSTSTGPRPSSRSSSINPAVASAHAGCRLLTTSTTERSSPWSHPLVAACTPCEWRWTCHVATTFVRTERPRSGPSPTNTSPRFCRQLRRLITLPRRVRLLPPTRHRGLHQKITRRQLAHSCLIWPVASGPGC